MITNTDIRINNPKVNEVVFYQPPRTFKRRDKKPYPVIIKEGCYLSNGRLSNFWYWQRVTPSGRIKSGDEHGYGNFTKAEGWKIEIKVKVINE